jgi:hypothetical protein
MAADRQGQESMVAEANELEWRRGLLATLCERSTNASGTF